MRKSTNAATKNLFALVLCLVSGALTGWVSASESATVRRAISLDGTWRIAEGGMDKPPTQFEHAVPVPELVDLAQPAFEEVGVNSTKREAFWYRRTFWIEGAIPPVARIKFHKAMFGTRVTEQATTRRMLRDLVNRVFGRSPAAVVVSLLDDADLDEARVRELQAILEFFATNLNRKERKERKES